jgi:hypothetical protein
MATPLANLPESGPLGLFLCSYLALVIVLAGALGLGWALGPGAEVGAWPLPPRYSRSFRLAFLGLLGALGGFPPFFFLAPKLALFSALVARGSWGLLGLMGAALLAGWYVYWQGATGLFEGTAQPLRGGRPLSRGGALALALALGGPLLLSGFVLDLWALAQWLA